MRRSSMGNYSGGLPTPPNTLPKTLVAHKGQTAVEQDHHILKGPLGVAPRFLKDPAKITAYGSLVSMAVLIWQVMQAVPSRNAERWGVSLPHSNGHPLATRHDHAPHQGDFD